MRHQSVFFPSTLLAIRGFYYNFFQVYITTISIIALRTIAYRHVLLLGIEYWATHKNWSENQSAQELCYRHIATSVTQGTQRENSSNALLEKSEHVQNSVWKWQLLPSFLQ